MTAAEPSDGSARTRDWNAFSAVVAVLVGLLALLVSGYTAHIQKEQVRAQVWPYLLVSNEDPRQAVEVLTIPGSIR